jgi:hypothetical protein
MIDDKLIKQLKFVLEGMANEAFYEWEESNQIKGLSDRDRELWCDGYMAGRLEENFENRERNKDETNET